MMDGTDSPAPGLFGPLRRHRSARRRVRRRFSMTADRADREITDQLNMTLVKNDDLTPIAASLAAAV